MLVSVRIDRSLALRHSASRYCCDVRQGDGPAAVAGDNRQYGESDCRPVRLGGAVTPLGRRGHRRRISGDVVLVKETLRHADLRTTMGYTHLAKEHLRALVEEEQVRYRARPA